MDWPRFLSTHGVEYQESGPNVSTGNISIRCPFCGAADPSFHMSISLEERGWRCWRNHDHRGRSPIRLVQGLLGCSFEQAANLCGAKTLLPNNFAENIKRMLNPEPDKIDEPARLDIPEEFHEFDLFRPLCKPFVNYMLNRGYTKASVMRLTERHKMLYCTTGPFAGRIIFLVYHKGKLVTWTGRSVADRPTIRYKSLSTDPEKFDGQDGAVPHGKITDYLLWHDQLKSCKNWASDLYICEGPFDALRVNTLGFSQGVVATSLFGSGISDRQIELLHDLVPNFKRTFLLLDQGTMGKTLRMQSQLTALGIKIRYLPPGVKDPALLRSLNF